MRKNSNECGEPAFDNIEELLSEKIVNHSKKFSPPSHEERKDKEKTCSCSNKINLCLVFFLIFLIIPMVIFLKFKKSHIYKK